MKIACCVLASSVLFVACGGTTTPAPPAAAAPAQKPYGNLAQMMRAIPFPASNIIFAAQTEDPAATKKEGGADRYANIAEYAGWTAVENAALALSETANLLMVPGRVCSNGKPAPENNEDYKKATAMLADAGQAAYKAAQSKDMDKILEVSETITTACSACHDVYREKDDLKDRCTAPPAAAK